MKKLIYILIVTNFSLLELLAFAPSMSLEDKCKKSDIIIKGAVMKIVELSVPDDKVKRTNPNKPEPYSTGPNSVAIVYIETVLKGDRKLQGSLIFVPCDYGVDVSPCELSESIKYVLFLESMGRNYYHPLGPYCMHRIHGAKIGLSGFDWMGDFDNKSANGKNAMLSEFVRKINSILKIQKKDASAPIDQKAIEEMVLE